jgi:hypothetical protein
MAAKATQKEGEGRALRKRFPNLARYTKHTKSIRRWRARRAYSPEQLMRDARVLAIHQFERNAESKKKSAPHPKMRSALKNHLSDRLGRNANADGDILASRRAVGHIGAGADGELTGHGCVVIDRERHALSCRAWAGLKLLAGRRRGRCRSCGESESLAGDGRNLAGDRLKVLRLRSGTGARRRRRGLCSGVRRKRNGRSREQRGGEN